ncbi:MAG: bifunctional phosphoribosylaminoimidazolecarboxamide formyltransferase/IMP cyclohydrolase [Spirochaetaceae bacterium]|nr:bifunctional phosphoribosylaminoimidazolecarboxamide formyltransferase/IMP cyclohydrolase [Spirochaetaceae bacterium]
MKRALISVYDKTGIAEFAEMLITKGIEIISSGGTYRFLKEKGIDVIEVNQVTGFDEIMDGRVKTLHPSIHGGILARRNNKSDMNILKEKNITPIDIVVVNLYPFFEKYGEDISFDEKLEFIDIGGPTMLRAAAKNFRDVIVITNPEDYSFVLKSISETGDVDFKARRHLAGKVFNLMSAYDGAVSNFLLEDDFPEYLAPVYKKKSNLRYGENPHQDAAFYTSLISKGSMNGFTQLQGKELSYNNIRDMDIAWKVVCEFEDIACCGLKHNTPCGAAIGENIFDAYKKAHEGDPVSIFGGIVAVNRTLDKETAEEMTKTFLEVVLAPSFSKEALEILSKKKNLRLIQGNLEIAGDKEFISVDGGLLVQDADAKDHEKMDVVTNTKPNESQISDMLFGEIICKYVKSNAIVVVKDKQVLGVGAGQVNRIWAAEQALERAASKFSDKKAKGAVLISDAFFPFSDVVETAAKWGVTTILQPGGSIRDEDSVKACNEAGIAMVFTGTRHFKH